MAFREAYDLLAEVDFLHLFVVQQLVRLSFECNATAIDHIHALTGLKRELGKDPPPFRPQRQTQNIVLLVPTPN